MDRKYNDICCHGVGLAVVAHGVFVHTTHFVVPALNTLESHSNKGLARNILRKRRKSAEK